jgi:fibronectin-binding autotransporter adhesin
LQFDLFQQAVCISALFLMRPIRLLLLLGGLVPAMLSAQTTLNWQPGGSGTGFSGTGTWDTTTSNWTSDNTGMAAPGIWTNGSVAHFGANGTAYTVTVSSGISISGIILDGAYNSTDFVGSNLALNGSFGTPTITLGANIPTPIFDVGFTGSSGLNIVANDGSSLELHGSSTYTGVTTIGGLYQTTVFVGDPAALGATGPGNGTVVNDIASLWLGNAAASSSISVAEDFTFTTTGVLKAAVSQATVTGNIILGSDLRLIAGGNTLELDGIISESVAGRGLTVVNSGKTVLTGANTFTGNISIQAGTLWISTLANSGVSSAAGKGSGFTLGAYDGEGYYNGTLVYTGGVNTSSDRSIVLAGNTGTINVNNPGITLTLNGVISGSGGGAKDLEKAGLGTLVLTGANTFTGNTDLTGGTLIVGNNTALGTGVAKMVEIGDIGTAADANLSLLLTNGVTLSEKVCVDALNSESGSTTLGLSGIGAATFANDVYITMPVNVKADTGGTLTFNGYFTDGSSLIHNVTKTGAGTAVFTNGIDLRNGKLTVSAGEVQLRSPTVVTNLNFFSGGVTVSAGGILSGDTAITGGNVIVGTGGTITPGINGIGSLTINDLYLSDGATVHWQLASLTTTGTPEILLAANNDTFTEFYATSSINVDLSLLGISSRPTSPVLLSNNVFWQTPQSWLVVDFNSASTNTNLLPGTLNPVSVTNGVWAGGVFTTFMSGSGDLMLQFSPVPEPSTYALLGLGGLMLLLPRWRRRA